MNTPNNEGIGFNKYRQDPVHYNNTLYQKMKIKRLHKKEGMRTLAEAFKPFMGTLSSPDGQLKMDPENHALSTDRFGLVVNHLNEVDKLIDEESTHEFVQEVKKYEDRLNYIKKNR